VLDRFAAFLDRPLDPRAGRAMLALAAAILLGFAALFVLGAGESPRRTVPRERAAAPTAGRSVPAPRPVEGARSHVAEPARHVPRQDPQDERGSAAARRAASALRTHRALQHVPYRQGRLGVQLVGARGSRALLRVSAPTVAAARRGWRAFLRRYDDAGRSYIPLFDARRRGARGRGA
jgi:hypothetical protein